MIASESQVTWVNPRHELCLQALVEHSVVSHVLICHVHCYHTVHRFYTHVHAHALTHTQFEGPLCAIWKDTDQSSKVRWNGEGRSDSRWGGSWKAVCDTIGRSKAGIDSFTSHSLSLTT